MAVQTTDFTDLTPEPSPTAGAAQEGWPDHEASRDAFAERHFEALLAAGELLSVHVGIELGLYEALTSAPATPVELAERTSIHPRYAREWLEQQAAAGVVDVVAEQLDGDPDGRTFALPSGHAESILDEESPAYVGANPRAITGIVSVLGDVVEAFRTGGGVSFADYGADIRHGIGSMNRPAYVNGAATWFGHVPGLDDRVRTGGRVLDIGCGVGWSTITLAQAYPRATFVGIDLDEASIEDARANAAAAGVAERVTFRVLDAMDIDEVEDPFDAVGLFEVLHDSAHPVEILRRIREHVGPDTPVVIADQRVAEEFTAPADFTDRLTYTWSVLHCLPATMAEEPSIATGTVIRPATVDEYARAAGYDGARVLPIENDFWWLYELRG